MGARLLNFWLRGGGATAQILAKEKSVRLDGARCLGWRRYMRETFWMDYNPVELPSSNGVPTSWSCTLYKSR